ncbi:MAG: hypothetical protein CMJ59_01525 [Planctomycetaceae bacterium]|nr:hypothetical protein [Planctomycetaceae bacterium]
MRKQAGRIVSNIKRNIFPPVVTDLRAGVVVSEQTFDTQVLEASRPKNWFAESCQSGDFPFHPETR